MSLLPNNTYANPDNSFYALAGSGGGSTLQSPVDVLPSAAGSISISGIAGVGGSAELSLLAGAVQPANIFIGQNLGETYLIEANPSQLTIGAGALTVGQTPVFQYTQTTGAVNLGDNTAGGGITTNSPLAVGAFAAGTNHLAIIPSSATSTSIIQSALTGGTISIGSSQVVQAASTLQVADNGTDGSVLIAGRGSGGRLLLQGGDTAGGSAGTGYITMGTTAGTEVLYIGANGNGPNYNSIEITTATVSISKPLIASAGVVIGAPTIGQTSLAGYLTTPGQGPGIVLVGAANFATLIQPNVAPQSDGFWNIQIYSTLGFGETNYVAGYESQFSMMAYYDHTIPGWTRSGGSMITSSGNVRVSNINGNTLTPVAGALYFFNYNSVNIGGMECVITQMTGKIPTMQP